MLSILWYSVSPYMHTEKKRRCHAKPVVPPFSTPAMAKSGGVDFCRFWMCGRKVTWRRRVAIGVEPCKAENTAIMILALTRHTVSSFTKTVNNGVKASRNSKSCNGCRNGFCKHETAWALGLLNLALLILMANGMTKQP